MRPQTPITVSHKDAPHPELDWTDEDTRPGLDAVLDALGEEQSLEGWAVPIEVRS